MSKYKGVEDKGFLTGGHGYRDKEIGYKTVLLYHLNNISTISTAMPGSGPDNSKYVFCKAVLVLDSLLSPYTDDEYTEGKKKLDKTSEDKDDFKYAIALLSLIMKQMARLGMLLESSYVDSC